MRSLFSAPLAAALAGVLALAVAAPAAAGPRPGVDLGRPLPQAHAHNDYHHERPLLDALEHGFTSVEADVWLVDGELLVAHDAWELPEAGTFEDLYLDPLTNLVKGKGRGVYPRWDGTFQLLVDIKTEAESTYAAVEDELAEHRRILARYQRGKVHRGPVQAVISGNRPLETMRAAKRRYGFYDGRSGDLGGPLDARLMPLVSDNWNNLFGWRGVGPMPAAERARLHEMVDSAHRAGQRIRFWATPDAPGPARDAVWTELRAAGVDHINTDDLPGLREFLTGGRQPAYGAAVNRR
ncbi:phosphatidylinositol-specific phospholipase C/glycerophosphodiester phosphodiesterase family protein [Actinomadura sp. WMMB 499]|uniref:phosphatidylinositol-specific phospholipase C/glycerophosphodiester phosphodiesterase family protein n=1 Tax=Actinomadura sp. WMMB 499 TaxID=1219491 RepID=UPI0012465067|nr:phosphatidylinositol-specific phospholipase C/glycerophosphodiester phosphodiesterase family protein [Actinomadura sp. WMMB 499]QFG23592.1 hypothetical protein F7P10_23185 [Actinomadura sp. WMMB 499]